MIRWDAGPRAGEQCSGETRAAMHHGAKNSACRNTPPVKCATLKTSDNASIPLSTRIRCFGHVSRRASHRTSTACRPTDGRISRPVRPSVGASLRERRRKMNAITKISDSDRYARCIRDVQAGALGHRRRRDPRPPLRYRPQVPSGRAVAGRGVHHPVGRREALRQPDPGPHLRQRLRAGRALHQRQGAGTQPAITGSATRSRSRRWSGSATRS